MDLRNELLEVIRSRKLSMKPEEAEKLAGYVGRMPTPLEFHLFDTMWSEHCSYKSSRTFLKRLPVAGPLVVLGPGEDAGIVTFTEHRGQEWDLVVAHESHNHPSQVLPVEGAATGIGGIVRDVYCMGAQVIGSLDLLRFGNPSGPSGERCRAICRGVVEGIWKYGNALGVPNLGGDTRFHPGYDDNCLVNVVALGLVRRDRIVHSFAPREAHEEQYVLILAGKPTDDTGFGGATFASSDLEDESEKGAVQVADPFLKRVLSEANAAVLKYLFETGVSFGFKDLGAGGIACVTSEMAAHGGLGILVDLDSVPVSVDGLPSEVIACAETQERYGLAVPLRVAEDVMDIYNEMYELPRLFPGAGATLIGNFSSDPSYRVMHRGEEVANAPVACITEGIVYSRESRPAPVIPVEPGRRPCDPPGDLLRMLHSLDGASRSPIWSYYDSEVQGNTRFRPGEADACVTVPIPGCSTGLAVSGDGNPWYGELDPFLAGAHAVGEAYRNVVAAGGVPIAITDCLNYGNPEDPEVFWQFRQGVEGIALACGKLGIQVEGQPLPVVSGNVSFYNQSSSGGAIPPSPIVAVFGRVDDFTRAMDISFKEPGNLVLLAGIREDELGGSLYYRQCLDHKGGRVPDFRGDLERAMAKFVLTCTRSGISRSVHDISEGGLLMAAAEMSLASRRDARRGMVLYGPADDPVYLYSETPGYLLEVTPEDWESMDQVPDFVSVAGRVTDEFAVSCGGWRIDLQPLVERHTGLLDRLIWREEGEE
ncbi:MAG: phosphoribosylformylglycinamidine synthase subunit PurL [Candidatus Fermentibacteraceae bacterium]|nr:phosphoribosylformylglycinamidine synthase subunit PurL [Candidatus Fermentibacteraceae bacterium]MBN2608721.1 phosphoribosylformylglycinamidine synthase subunit PurL [Candidatus Fermentibacteraceae bacterium]